MTKLVCVPLLLLAVLISVYAEPCVSPDGSPGNCVQIFGCPVLAKLLRNEQRTPEDTLLLKKSSCGFEERVPKVCCPNSCLTLSGEQGTCVANSSCPHLKYTEAKRCLGSDTICCPPLKQEVLKESCAKSLTAFPLAPKSYCCGSDGQSVLKILYGGSEGSTNIDQYPWMALIEYQIEKNKTKLMCGGSLISGKYVLTAAHCITGPALKRGIPTAVRLGEYDTTKDVDCKVDRTDPESLDCTSANDTITIPIESAIHHPLYDSTTGKHDIALIRLKHLAPYTDFINPICLPSKDYTTDYTLKKLPVFNLFVGGWGLGSLSHTSMMKQDVLLPYVEREDCQKFFSSLSPNVSLGEGQICAGGKKGKSPCKGDTGGTLMHLLNGEFEAIGVMSFGASCAAEDIPTVYTKVFEYIDWIYSVIEP